jgi:hypothetical protein
VNEKIIIAVWAIFVKSNYFFGIDQLGHFRDLGKRLPFYRYIKTTSHPNSPLVNEQLGENCLYLLSAERGGGWREERRTTVV